MNIQNWKECKLGDFVESISETYSFKRNEQVVFLNTSDIYLGKVLNNKLQSSDNLPGQAKKKIKKGDFLFSEIRPANGRYATIDFDAENYVVSTKLMVLRCKSEIDSNFFKIFLTSKEQIEYLQMAAEDRSGTFPQITFDQISKLELALPPFPEQRAIAGVLSSLDDKIDLLHRQNKTLEGMAEALFRKWFVEEVNENWKEKSLSELLTITSSKRIFYSEYLNVGVPFYRSREIIELHNTGSTNSELYISEERFNDIESKYGAPVEGDILLTSVGTLGIPYLVKKNDKFYFKDGNLTWFKDFKGISSKTIYCWLNSRIGKEQLDSIKIGSTQSALTISGLKELKLLIPPENELKIVENSFFHIFNKIQSNQTQVRNLEKLRDTLLPNLMSGEVRLGL